MFFDKMKFSKIVPSDKQSIDNLTVSFEDGFEVITMYGQNQQRQTPSLYPVTPNLPYSVNPTVPTFSSTSNMGSSSNQMVGKSSHPLDGIPFKLSPALEMSTFNTDPLLEDVKNTLSRVEKMLYSEELKYDFRLEKDILGEN